MAKNKVVDAESAIKDIKNKKFGLSIQNIIALVTVLSTGIAGWYSFTGRINGLEEIVTGFADASDIELVTSKLESYDEDIKYLRDKLDNLKTPKIKSYDKDVANINNELKSLKREIKKLEELLKDPLADFKQEITMKNLLLISLMVFIGCAASVQTEQYVGEYEKQKSMDDVIVTKVDGLKILEVRANKEMEERYPELAEKRVAFGLTQEFQNVVSYIGRFNMIEADRDMQLAIRNDLKANKAKITTAKYSGYVTIYDFAVNLKEEIKAGKVETINETIVGIQVKLINNENTQYVVGSGQGRASTIGRGFLMNPNMEWNQSSLSSASNKAMETAVVNVIKAIDRKGW